MQGNGLPMRFNRNRWNGLQNRCQGYARRACGRRGHFIIPRAIVVTSNRKLANVLIQLLDGGRGVDQHRGRQRCGAESGLAAHRTDGGKIGELARGSCRTVPGVSGQACGAKEIRVGQEANVIVSGQQQRRCQ